MDALCALIPDFPPEVVARALALNLQRGYLVFDPAAGWIEVADFAESEEATKDNALRQREYRARRKDAIARGLKDDERGPSIYFIQAESGGPIKIGYASDLAARLAGLQTSHPDQLRLLATVQGTAAEEAQLHSLLEPHCARGEWFHPTEDVMVTVRYASQTDTCNELLRHVTLCLPSVPSVPLSSPPSFSYPEVSSSPVNHVDVLGATPGPQPKFLDEERERNQELNWRLLQCWEVHLEARARFFAGENGYRPGRTPTLTKAIAKTVRTALLEHDAHLLRPDQRLEWVQTSAVRAAGIGLFMDPWCTGKANNNRVGVDEGARYFLESDRAWRPQRGKPDPIPRFAELYWSTKDAQEHHHQRELVAGATLHRALSDAGGLELPPGVALPEDEPN